MLAEVSPRNFVTGEEYFMVREKNFYINIRKKEKFHEEKNIKSNDYVFLYKRVI